ncbi:Uma2 family endonuclease [Calothrix sp. CCY 0018]|uniref:Uma2 family endonuclease n=1 Tax=Calothrix sp. CCY 0018 TaxID=3103864 RepID=UPI0039C5E874
MTYTPPKLLTFEQFIAEHGDNARYELIDGELRDMEPTGPHEEVSGNIAGRVYAEIFRSNLNWLIPKTCLIKPPAAEATALRPDVIVLDKEKLKQEPLWEKEPIICRGDTIKLVAEVVSTNWQDDYARKVEEYSLLEIPEYWIIDFRSLGGLQFIGKPKQPTFTVCQLVDGIYQQQKYRLGDVISSYLFPNLQLKLDDIMP